MLERDFDWLYSMKKRDSLKNEKNSVKKSKKSCRMSLFDLNFCMPDHLHDVMHGQNSINRMIDGISSSDS